MGSRLRQVAVVVLASVLSACSNIEETIDQVLPEDGTAYKTSGSVTPLEVPPGLASSTIRDSYPVAGVGSGSATLSQYNAQGQARRTEGSSSSRVLPILEDARIARTGDQRYLVVKATPGQLWPKLRDFWLQNGFLLSVEDPAIGIMETAWAEKREDLPAGAIQRLLSKINTAAYSFATRDRFRIRLERGAEPGTTEVYVAHRGAEEKSQGSAFVWVPRPPDPELEAELLGRMMVSFGVRKEAADQLIAESNAPREQRAQMLRDAAGAPVLALRDGFSRAWRRTGLALDRVGFTVEDRDRSRGLFYVRYVDPLADENKQKDGWLDKLKFWGDDGERLSDNEFLISLVGGESSTQVQVLDKRGQREQSGTGDRILNLLHEQLR